MRLFTFLLFALLFPLAAAHSQVLPRVQGPGDQNWDTRFGPPAAGGLGLNNHVEAIAELPNGNLIVTGSFQDAGGDSDADYIARWDGTAWNALGTGLNGVGKALAVAPNGDLFVGGYFATAGSVANTGKIARWDGTAWHAVGTGIDVTGTGSADHVNALVILPNGDLVAGGTFTHMGGSPDANFLARWDGTAWQRFGAPLGNGINPSQIEDVAVGPTGEVVIGGSFFYGNGFPLTQYLSRLNGTVWEGIGLINDAVSALKFASNGDLFVAGQFTDIGTIAGTRYVARWDGTAWHPLGTGVNNPVSALAACPNGDLLVGGTFFDAGRNPSADNIARWDGTAWQSLGTGLTHSTFLTIGALYGTTTGDYVVGGAFSSVGDGSVLMQNFGIYHPNAVGLPEASVSLTALCASPNPAHGTLQAQLPARFTGPLTLTVATGRTVRTQTLASGQTTATLDLDGVAPGVYVLRAGAAVQRVLID
jgi:trimeric autotransporter adhesin